MSTNGTSVNRDISANRNFRRSLTSSLKQSVNFTRTFRTPRSTQSRLISTLNLSQTFLRNSTSKPHRLLTLRVLTPTQQLSSRRVTRLRPFMNNRTPTTHQTRTTPTSNRIVLNQTKILSLNVSISTRQATRK